MDKGKAEMLCSISNVQHKDFGQIAILYPAAKRPKEPIKEKNIVIANMKSVSVAPPPVQSKRGTTTQTYCCNEALPAGQHAQGSVGPECNQLKSRPPRSPRSQLEGICKGLGVQKHKWPTIVPSGDITRATGGGPQRLIVGDKNNSGQQMGLVATSHYRLGSPTLRSRGQKQYYPTSGPCGYITPAIWEVPNPSEQGTKTKVAHNCSYITLAVWGAQCFTPDKNRSGTRVGRSAKTPPPSGGSQCCKAGDKMSTWNFCSCFV